MKEKFIFKQFTIYHDRCAMKVGTDGVLLGAWAKLPSVGNVLDVGTGCGLIAIMVAQRCNALVTGIDIDKDAIYQATENGKRTPWDNRLHFIHSSIQEYVEQKNGVYEAILCNPPFFSNSLLSPNKKRSVARHTSTLTFGDLIYAVTRLLHPHGTFNIILPVDRAEEFRLLGWERGLSLQQNCLVYTKSGGTPKRALMSFCKDKCCYPTMEQLFITESNGMYTQAYRELTGDFYLE